MTNSTSIAIPSDASTGSLNWRPLLPHQVRWSKRRTPIAPSKRRQANESRVVRRFQAWFDANREAVMSMIPEI